MYRFNSLLVFNIAFNVANTPLNIFTSLEAYLLRTTHFILLSSRVYFRFFFLFFLQILRLKNFLFEYLLFYSASLQWAINQMSNQNLHFHNDAVFNLMVIGGGLFDEQLGESLTFRCFHISGQKRAEKGDSLGRDSREVR